MTTAQKRPVRGKPARPPAAAETAASRQRFERLLREAAFFICAAITLFLLAALVSFNPGDPGWSTPGDGSAIVNLFGAPGAWCADVLLRLFGYAAFGVPFVFLYGGWLICVQKNPVDADPLAACIRPVALILCVLAACGLFWLCAGSGAMWLPYSSGGVVGLAIAEPMVQVLKWLGAAWALVTVFGVTLSIGMNFSWVTVAERIGAGFLGGITGALRSMAGAVQRSVTATSGRMRARADRRAERRQHKRQQKKDAAERKTLSAPARSAAPADDRTATPAPAANKPAKSARGQRAETRAPRKSAAKPAAESQLDLPMGSDVEVPRFDPATDDPRPPTTLLDPPPPAKSEHDDAVLAEQGRQLEQHLADFRVKAEVTAIQPGPVVTRFELVPAPGVKVSSVTNLAKDLARAMSVRSVRVVEVIPGRSVIGLEIPNPDRETVGLREIVESPVYVNAKSALTIALGKDIAGHAVTADLAKMPHLLVAGTTGSGKSVAVNAMILSILHKAGPDQVRLIMIDPKMLELSVYEAIPHLLAPVVTDMKDAANALRWCVGEMERRYKLMAALGVRNIAGFNAKVRAAEDAGTPIEDPIRRQALTNDQIANGETAPPLEPMPAIVVIVDELADMMMVVGKKVEELIARLAQKARAAGLHMILATQRPSVDVITGLIKANIPTRIAFQVASKIDSRTILDQQGAESLLGHGDMLYLPPGSGFSNRVHGAFVDDPEVHRVVEYLKQTGAPDYVEDILEGGAGSEIDGEDADDPDAETDPLYDQAVAIVTKSRKASISYVQRRLRVGYNRAARLVEQMEAGGVVSAVDGASGRDVLAPPPPED